MEAGAVSERLSREQLEDYAEMLCSGASCKPPSCEGCKTPPDDGEECPKIAIAALLSRIAALEAEVSELLPMADVAGWWQGEFQMANVDRNELRAENERLRSTLAAKETVQRANEDEMSADNERLRDALLGIVGLPDVHAKELEIAVDALSALEAEVRE
jgi:regulator of replication initiation timing